jgi:hypothetical protein
MPAPVSAEDSDESCGRRQLLPRRAARRERRRAPAIGQTSQPRASQPQWTYLVDGKTLKNWEVTDFAGHGEVTVKNGGVQLETGAGLTGLTWKGKPLPTTDYEVQLEAQRVDGVDFFCGITFPVGKTFCCFICGGWGGAVVGLSNIDDFDASENDTTKYLKFDDKKWYKFRIRVTDTRIETWIDGKLIVNQPIKDRRVGIRFDIEQACPFGISCWQTTAGIRKLRIRQLTAAEVKESEDNKVKEFDFKLDE